MYTARGQRSAQTAVSVRERFLKTNKKFLPPRNFFLQSVYSEGEGEGGRIQAKGLLRAGAQERKYSCTCSAEEGRLTNYVTSELATGVAVLSHVGERHLGA